ncbi:putative non-specific serine/threonine protein kinase [Helianthus debilis subsp. tardiflorus]
MISSTTNSHVIYLCTFLVCCYCYSCSAKDNITTDEFIEDGFNLESEGKKFQMGFFSLGNASEVRRYVGIWYTRDPKTVVWVANRDKPVLDYTGVLTVAKDGNFKVLNIKDDVYFTTDTDTGNMGHG